MIAVRLAEVVEHLEKAVHGVLARDPAALRGHDHGHDAEAGAAHGEEIVLDRAVRAARGRGPCRFGMREVPEISETLPLNQIQQGFVSGARMR